MAFGTTSLVAATVIVLISAAFLVAQPPSPKQDPRAVERRIGEIRNRLERNAPANAEQRELASFAQRYLDEAIRVLGAGYRFQAQRLADAADAGGQSTTYNI